MSRNKCVVLVILVLVLGAASVPALAKYTEPASFLEPSRVITMGDVGYTISQGDDSAVFQKAIDDVSNAGGGKVIVPRGDYALANVTMKSDVHLVFDGASTIRPFLDTIRGPSVAVFTMGERSFTENTSIRSINGMTRFILKGHRRLRAFIVFDTRNFLLSNFNVEDTRTTFSAVELSWSGQNADGSFRIPTNGTVQHIRNSDAGYGYGTIQAQASRNVFFKDIVSVGGVALRLETGWKAMNARKAGGVYDIRAEDITVHRGQAAVMLMPHSIHNGTFEGKNIKATTSEFAVLVEKGSLHKFKEREINELGLTLGTFKAIDIDGIHATYSDGPIRSRWIHLAHYPEALHSKIVRVSNNDYRAPTIAAVSVPDLKAPNLNLQNVVGHGFLPQAVQVDESDYFQGEQSKMFRTDVPNARRLIGDFNNDRQVNVVDLDMLFNAFGKVEAGGPYDLANNDGIVNQDDVKVWLYEVNGNEYGDANLDGRVTALDLEILAASFGKTGGWGEGDFNGDKRVDLKDLAILRTHYNANPPGGGIPFSQAATQAGLPVTETKQSSS